MSSANTDSKQTEPSIPIMCPGHSRRISDLSFSYIIDQQAYLISSSIDYLPMIRYAHTGDWIGTFSGHKGAVWMARLNSEAKLVVTASADYTAKLWDAITGENIYTWPTHHNVKASIFSQCDKYAYIGGHSKKLEIFDLNDYNKPPQVCAEQGVVQSITNCQDENLIITSTHDESLRIWDRRTLQIAKKIPISAKISDVRSTLDKSTIVCCADQYIHLFDASKLDLIVKMKMPKPIECAAYSTVAQKIVVASSGDSVIRVYDSNTQQQTATYRGHHGEVTCLDVSPFGDTFASGADDATIRIWEW